MQAIQTKFLGPTNNRGARIKATCDAGSVTISWDYSGNVEEMHAKAAMALACKLEWFGSWICGSLPGAGFAFVWCGGPDAVAGARVYQAETEAK